MLGEIGCVDVLRWEAEDMPKGRHGKLASKFEGAGLRGTRETEGTVEFLKGLLRWVPGERWTAREAIGNNDGEHGREARAWWESKPNECGRDGLRDLGR